MLVDLAVTWAEHTLKFPAATEDAVRGILEAERSEQCVTILIGNQLTRDRKCRLMRWTGDEVVVVGLSGRDQRHLGLEPKSMTRSLQPRDRDARRSLEQIATLSDVTIDDSRRLRPEQPITGTCLISSENYQLRTNEKWALRADYFQPARKRRRTGFWHLNAPLLAGSHQVRFSLPALERESKRAPRAIGDLAVLFLQLVASDDPHTMRRQRGLSNTVAALVEVSR